MMTIFQLKPNHSLLVSLRDILSQFNIYTTLIYLYLCCYCSLLAGCGCRTGHALIKLITKFSAGEARLERITMLQSDDDLTDHKYINSILNG